MFSNRELWVQSFEVCSSLVYSNIVASDINFTCTNIPKPIAMAEDLKKMYRTIVDDHFPPQMEISFVEGNKRQTLCYEKVLWTIDDVQKGLRYGENPGQEAALYKMVNGNLVLGEAESIQPGQYLASDIELLQSGKHPGKTNLTDADNSLNILRYFMDKPTVVIVKHNNPCGVARSDTLEDAYLKANMADRVIIAGLLLVAVNAHAGVGKPRAHNMRLVGTDDLQARSAYQPIVQHQIVGNHERWIAYIGHHNGSAPNPLLPGSPVQTNGVSIVDVTDPKRPVYLHHLPGVGGAHITHGQPHVGSQAVRIGTAPIHQREVGDHHVTGTCLALGGI